MYTCTNCGTVFEGTYCTNCKQSAPTERITWTHLLHEALHGFLHIDRGLFYSIKELAIHPGTTIRDYLAGKRGYHINPALFLFLTSSFASLIYILFHVHLPNQLLSLDVLAEHNNTLAYKYFILVGITVILLLSLSDYLLYRKEKLLLPELIVSNTFQMSEILVFIILLLPIFKFQGSIYDHESGIFDFREWLKVLIPAYLIWVRYQFHNVSKNKPFIILVVLQVVAVYLFYNYLVVTGLSYLLGKNLQ